MTDDEFSESDLEILRLLAAAGPADELASEIEGGFSAERARTFLDNDERFEELADLVFYVEPGPGWYHAAAQADERGALNRDLLLRALEIRQDEPEDLYRVTRAEGRTRLTQRHGWLEPAEALSVELPGGTATWASRGAGLPSSIEYSGAPPAWLGDLLGEGCVAALSDGVETLSTEETALSDLLSRYALGRWLQRWHPGGEALPFAEGLLRVELGAVAWRASDAWGSPSEARVLLEDAGAEIVALARRAHSWTGWRRDLADSVLQEACEAYLDLFPRAADVDLVRNLARATPGGSAAPAALPPQTRRGLALAAGGMVARGEQATGFTVDPALVPPRSVSAASRNALVEIVDHDGGMLVRVLVAQGQQPVPALAATLVVDRERHVIELRARDDRYEGILGDVDEPLSVEAHVHHPGYAGPFRGAGAIEATLGYVEAVLAARRAVYEDLYDEASISGLPSVPFLAEIAGWGDDQ